jgi:EAL domain-containing protein (putative c-di-GMP-specific phosphodiesterase class I)
MQHEHEHTKHYEILLRMKGESNRYVAPTHFISAAERFHLMVQIDEWVVTEAIKLLSSPMMPHDVVLAINLSGQSIANEVFQKNLMRQIAGSQINPNNLCFEITETAAIENIDQASQLIDSIKTLGCRFLLDDFGSGLSSFGYLKNFDIDFIKIDGTFVKELHRNTADTAIVESISHVSKAMGILTVAEYVENDELYKIVKDIGVDYAQGFGIHRPEPATNLLMQQTPTAVI